MTKDLYPIAELALAIAKRKGAAEAGARVGPVRGRRAQLARRKGGDDQGVTTRSLSVALYVDGRYGVMSTSDLRTESLEVFVGDAVALTRSPARDPVPIPAGPEASTRDAQALRTSISRTGSTSVTPELRRSVAKAIEAAARV
ncbi:MAG: hypothetical protein U0166_23440 [Acidobacteriota bacterium]